MLHGPAGSFVYSWIRQWQKIETVLGEKKVAGRPERDDRNFVEAVLWWRRTGALRGEFT